jgi:hypothetical protein
MHFIYTHLTPFEYKITYVKVFDFGLCKDLDPRLKAKDGAYGYRLTGRAGSLPYSKFTPAPRPVSTRMQDVTLLTILSNSGE